MKHHLGSRVIKRRLTRAQCARRLLAVQIVDAICAAVVENPEAWRGEAVDLVARALEAADHPHREALV